MTASGRRARVGGPLVARATHGATRPNSPTYKGGARLDQREQADPCVEMVMKAGDANPDGRLNENRRKRQATQDRPAVDDRPQHDAKLSVQNV